jgi:hypothetical protein
MLDQKVHPFSDLVSFEKFRDLAVIHVFAYKRGIGMPLGDIDIIKRHRADAAIPQPNVDHWHRRRVPR